MASEWAKREASRVHMSGWGPRTDSRVTDDIATALDAAREQGRREREAEIVGWLRGISDGPTAVVWNGVADEIERGAGHKEPTNEP